MVTLLTEIMQLSIETGYFHFSGCGDWPSGDSRFAQSGLSAGCLAGPWCFSQEPGAKASRFEQDFPVVTNF